MTSAGIPRSKIVVVLDDVKKRWKLAVFVRRGII